MAFPESQPASNLIRLVAGPAEVVIDLNAGARLSSWKVHGFELLEQRNHGNHPLGWGSYAMVPFIGRMKHGKFAFDGRNYELPINLETHAIHGTGFDNTWTVLKQTTSMAIVGMRMVEPWPFQGTITHLIQLSNDRLIQQIAVMANEDQPVTVGWHPWFRRELVAGTPKNQSLKLHVDFSDVKQWEKGAEAIPTGRLIDPLPRPWDDAFHNLTACSLEWPGRLRLTVNHDCEDFMLYDPPHAICAEPQSGPPNAFNMDADAYRLVEGDIHERTVEWRWQMASRF
jgi:aldose 1-epimerase